MRCPHCSKEIPLNTLAREMGRTGGSRTTAAKRKASRENGAKGGRPRQHKGRKH